MFASKHPKIHTVGSCISSFIPLSLLERITKAIPVIGYYHLVSEEEVLHIKHLYVYKNVKQFKDDLDFISNYFKPLSLLDFLARLKTGQELSGRVFLLTVDDGLREVHDVIAPILLEKGVPATLFVSSAFVDNKNLADDHKASLIVERLRKAKTPTLRRKTIEILQRKNNFVGDVAKSILGIDYHQHSVLDEIGEAVSIDFREYLRVNQPYLTSDQLAQLVRQGFAAGGHSIDHPMFCSLSLAQQLYQTRVSMKFVRERFGLNYGAFAFPHGDHGVSTDFFKEVQKDGLVDISFGTGGILEDTVQNHFQRFSLEKPPLPAEKVFAFQLLRRLYRVCRGCGKVVR